MRGGSRCCHAPASSMTLRWTLARWFPMAIDKRTWNHTHASTTTRHKLPQFEGVWTRWLDKRCSRDSFVVLGVNGGKLETMAVYIELAPYRLSDSISSAGRTMLISWYKPQNVNMSLPQSLSMRHTSSCASDACSLGSTFETTTFCACNSFNSGDCFSVCRTAALWRAKYVELNLNKAEIAVGKLCGASDMGWAASCTAFLILCSNTVANISSMVTAKVSTTLATSP